MPISLSKKKCKTPPKKLVEQKKCCSSLTNFVRYLYRVPIAISLLLLIYLWSSSSTIISGKIVHVCVSSRKLNSLYCLSAGTQPNFEIPIPTLDNSTGSTPEIDSTTSETLEKDIQSLELEKEISSSRFVTLELEKEVPSNPFVDTSTSSSPIVTLELEKEISSSPIVGNSTIGSPIVDTLGLEKEILSKSILVNNNTSFDPNVILELEKEIPDSPIVDNSTIGSHVVHLELERGISNSPILDKNTSGSPIVNLGLKKEISNSSIIANGTIGSPIVNLGLENNHVVTNLEVRSPIDNRTTTSSSIVDKKEGEINVLGLVRDSDSDPASDSDQSRDREENEFSGPSNAVELIVQELRVWTANTTKKSCDGRGIYVYDLPSKFNTDLIGQCDNMIKWIDFCRYLTNGGLGEPILKLGPAWYRTHMYALEPIFHARALNHPCRVKDESAAKLFYVPFYGGLDVLRWHFKNVSGKTKDALGLDLISYLSSRPTWTRNSGADHVFALGKISWDFRRSKGFSWGTSLLELPEMQSPAKVLIERQPWHSNDVGVPHPTYFHPRSDSDVLTWQAEVISSGRPHLACFAGAARPKSPENIRTQLMQQCSAASDGGVCRILTCNSGKGCGEPEELVGLFKESEFCLQPPGDSPTRRSVFDSLVSGCIPVLFDPFTAYYQYPWHLPEDRQKYSVFIDQNDVREKGVNVIEVLKRISKEEKDDMRRFIVYEILPGLVYADPDSRLENFRDAFSITVDSLVDRVNGML